MKTSDRKLGSGHSGPEVIFIDRDEPRLRAAEERVRASAARAYQAIASDCDPIPLADATGDRVVCKEVLEHVADPAQFLECLLAPFMDDLRAGNGGLAHRQPTPDYGSLDPPMARGAATSSGPQDQGCTKFAAAQVPVHYRYQASVRIWWLYG
jgi:hypothetical protein